MIDHNQQPTSPRYLGYLCILVFFLLVNPVSTLSQQRINFRTIASVNGLSQASVFTMAQDSAGFLWIGTKDGLNRFDGYDFINFKYDSNSENSLSNNEISCLEVDGHRYLWVGTRSGGVNRLEFSSGNITRFDNLTKDNLVRDIYLDSRDNLWVATSEGLFLFSRDINGAHGSPVNVSRTAVYRHVTNEPFIPSKINISIASILELSPGILVVGAEEGLFEYNIERNEFKSVSSETIATTIFTTLIEDKKGNIWAGSYDGLYKITRATDKRAFDVVVFNTTRDIAKKLPVDWVEQVIEDHSGRIWVGTRGGGLVRIVNDRVEVVHSYTSYEIGTLPDNIVNSLFIDRTGILWIGTESRGLVYLDFFAKQFHSVRPATPTRPGLSDKLVTAITGNNETLWVGTAGSGIDVFRISGNKVEKMYNIPRVILDSKMWKSEIISLHSDRDGVLWIGSSTNSLVSYSEETGFKSYYVNGFVFSLFEDDKENIWFGTWGTGLGFINKKSRVIRQFNQSLQNSLGLSSDKILSIFVDSRDYLWVGTKGGGVCVIHINHVINGTGDFHVLKHLPGVSNSLSYNDVYGILEDRNGSIWLATGSGLNKVVIPDGFSLEQSLLEGKVTFTHLNEQDGLTGGLVYTLQEDKNGDLWIGTNKGINRFSPSRNNFVFYGHSDGLPSGKFQSNGSFQQSESGLMFFGGIDGFSYFYPDSILPNPFPVSARITGLRLHNKLVLPGERINGVQILEKNISYTNNIELPFSNNEITFEFSALHFSSPEKNRYKYRLLGFNDQWQETDSDNRRATYTNLRPGDYIFEVNATNSDGVPGVEVARLNVTILPPLWRTSWAYALYLISFLFLLWIFRKYSIIGVKRKNSLIIESMMHKKESEIIEAKMQFFTNVSHEIRTPLSLINAPLQQLLKLQHDAETRDTLLVIHRNVKRLLFQVSQLLDFRKMDKGYADVTISSFAIQSLVNEILPSFEFLSRQKQIDISFVTNGPGVVKGDRNLMATVIYNLISNSLKFSPEKGRLSIEITGSAIQDKTDESTASYPNVIVRVSDTGPGIPESEMLNVFRRFYQLKDNDNSHLAGSGIGLSIAKEFIEKMGGTITGFNLPERGCCFEISLPAGEMFNKNITDSDQAPVSNHVVERIAIPSKNRESATNVHKRAKVLIVEDDIELSAYLQSFFEQLYETRFVNDGLKALEIITDMNPDVLICDVMLPGLNGMELCGRIKESETTSHVPVIMLTAKAEEESVVEGLTLGADSYIVKPFSIDVLAAQVASLIRSRETFRSRFSKQFVLEPTEEILTPMDEKFLKKLIETVESNMSDATFDVPQLIDYMHMSHSIILKKVKFLTGLSLVEFIRSMRIKKAAQILKQDKLSVSEVGFMVGFSDPKYFSKCFAREMGKKPTDYIREMHS